MKELNPAARHLAWTIASHGAHELAALDESYSYLARDIENLIDPETAEPSVVERLATHCTLLEGLAAILAAEALDAGPHGAKALAGGATRAAEGAARLMALRLQVLDWQRRNTQMNILSGSGSTARLASDQAPRLPLVLAGLPDDEMNYASGDAKDADA